MTPSPIAPDKRLELLPASVVRPQKSAGRNIEATFCFVDIAGYTALTDSHGESAAADLIEDFNDMVRTTAAPFGKLQELTGDCAFLVFPDPLVALDALAALYKLVADRKDFPVVRAGLHHGSALFRGNRYFGSTVNIAARMAAQAIGGEILCTNVVAEMLAQTVVPDRAIEHRGLVSLKNLPQPVDVYAIVLADITRQYAIDPVCQMQVDARHAAGVQRFEGRTYWFCSAACSGKFSQQPALYL